MAHAVIVTSYAFPGIEAPAHRVRAFAEAIEGRENWNVTVVGPGPDEQSKATDLDNLPYTVRTIRAGTYPRRNLVRRAISEVRHTWRLLAEARSLKPDVLIITIPSVFLLSGVFCGKRRPVVIDVRDLVWEYIAASKGGMRLAGRVLRWCAKRCIQGAAAVSVTNDLQARTIDEHSSVSPAVIRNGIAEARFERLAGTASSSDTDWDTGDHLVYVGNVGRAQGLDTLVEAARDLPNVKVTIVGGGSELERLAELAKRQGITNVTFVGPKPWDELMQYYREATVLYAQIGEEYKTAVPSKMFEYLSTGRPVIFGAPEGSARNLARDFANVLVVPPDDVPHLRHAIESLNKDGGELANKETIETVRREHLRERQAQKFADIVSGLEAQAMR